MARRRSYWRSPLLQRKPYQESVHVLAMTRHAADGQGGSHSLQVMADTISAHRDAAQAWHRGPARERSPTRSSNDIMSALAQSGHGDRTHRCPLLGVKRT